MTGAFDLAVPLLESVLFTLKQDRFSFPYLERILIGTRSNQAFQHL
ncbi:hypothetical protein FHS82_002638 [Pseudochelatococcus lubricantis]|uniref:Uncharacterized protein n=1 Tax=Pseudochelatococcus lubricantis TaxID=1538102 RepID=A0ABX0V2G2_9HYPH|nr:hypothetical protein [Pseudochelatococcus lubricantis]